MSHFYLHGPNRRAFLTGALKSSASFLMMPTLLGQIFSQIARAETPRDLSLPAFLVFDMNGGSGFVGNFLVGKQNGPDDLLSNYNLLGWNPKVDPLDRRFGIPMAWGPGEISKILKGILEATTPEAQAGLQIGSFCHTSQDDSAANQHSAVSLVAMAGSRGSLIESGTGTRPGLSGGNTGVPIFDSLLKPVSVGGADDILAAVRYHSVLASMPIETLRTLGKTLLGLNHEQAPRLSGMSGGQQLGALTLRAILKNTEVSEISGELDPRLDPISKSIYKISEGTKQDSLDVIRAAIVMNVLKSQTGPGTIMIDQCDYHTGTPVQGDQKDLETGIEIGRAVQMAYLMKKPLVFQLLTDGGISALPGTRNWISDDQEKTMTLLGYYNPKEKPSMRRIQVGHFTDGQGAARNTLIGTDTTQVAYSVLANYLAIAGAMKTFAPLVDGKFPIKRLDEVLIFG
ncbi:MAG: hypothetical protein AABZ55_11700 [Bdellovibrionota bacterium]